MKKNATRLLTMGAMLSPVSLYALGLGDIQLNSALNQPLDAGIQVVSATADELATLKVSIAGDDAFRRFGLDRLDFLSGVTLRVEGAATGQPVIRVRSSSAVTEPFLTLLVEATWSGGRMLREYTLLLDPPVFAPNSVATAPLVTPQGRTTPTPSGTIERPAAAAEPSPAPAPPPAPAPAAPVSAPVPAAPAVSSDPPAVAGDTYLVKSLDTLYQIAAQIRPGSRSGINQTMIALYRANPTAFGGNINLLRAGSVLRIPPAADIEAVSVGEASGEVARQYGAWRNAAATPATAAATEDAGRLRLVAPDSGSAGTSTAASDQNAAALNDRVRTLEAELAETKRLLDLRNAELARLQQATAPAAQTPPPAEAPEPAAPPAEPEATAPAEQAEPTPTPAPPAVQPAPQPAPAESPSLLDRLADYWLWAVGLGVVLIGALLLYIRRRKEEEATAESAIMTMTPGDFESRIPRTAQRREFEPEAQPQISSRFDQVADHDFAATDTDVAESAALSDAPAYAPAAKVTEDTLSSETAVQLDQQDALAEADFHMAYGLYDQAADLVKIAVQRDPQRRDLKLKLLEIYFVWGNRDLFLDTARELHDTQDQSAPGEWDKILIMGKQLAPDDALFAADIAGSRSADSIDVNLEGGENRVDIDLFEAPQSEQSKPVDIELAATGAYPGSGKESDIDFLLDEPVRGVDDDPTREIEAGARTQETPTIESPYLRDRSADTIREKIDSLVFDKSTDNIDQTAELSLDEIGLDVDSLDVTGSPLDDSAETGTRETQIGDDELTRVAKHELSPLDKTVETPRVDDGKTMLAPHMEEEDESGGTLTIDRLDIGGDTSEMPSLDTDSTGMFKSTQKIDVDLDRLSEPYANDEGDTVKRTGRAPGEDERFSQDVFSASQTMVNSNGGSQDDAPTALELPELPELEPVTMSEVGTKLDLARAYMDMGDPDGARSILDEVLHEGNPNQRQEAQRLLDSIG